MAEQFYMTRREVAEMFQVTEMTVGNWADNGLLKRVSVSNNSNRGMITASSVQKLKDDFFDIGNCEEEIRNYKHSLVVKNTELRESIRDARIQIEFVKNISSFLSLVSMVYEKIAKHHDSRRNIQIVCKALQGESFADIAKEYEVSKERVRQIISEAAERIQNAPEISAILYENNIMKKNIESLKMQLAVYEGHNKEVSNKVLRVLQMNVMEVNISNRLKNILFNNDMLTIHDVVLADANYIKNLENMGAKTYAELEQFLGGFGLSLGMTYSDIINL